MSRLPKSDVGIQVPVVSVSDHDLLMDEEFMEISRSHEPDMTIMEVPLPGVDVKQLKVSVSGRLLAVEHKGVRALGLRLPRAVDESMVRVAILSGRVRITLPSMADLPGGTVIVLKP